MTRKHELLETLALHLRSDRFQGYMLKYAQQQLATSASRIIGTITQGRYSLNFDEEEFSVRDTWNDTHQRSVKTLSGGETFIVSLALALALSDTIAGEHKLDALFLDEGFGTLDPEALDSVSDILNQLTLHGRLVGVITHVQSLTERLPERLIITKGQQGSRAAWATQ